MKNLIWWIPLLAMCNAHAQVATLETKSPPARIGEYAITERGPDHRVWARTEEEPGPFGKSVKRVHTYVELATGMHFKNAKGEWQEAEETIEQYAEGAVARRGQHKVIFANNLATPGAIDFETPDGKRLRSHIVGLSYFDTASGKSVLIAEVKDCEGKVMGNQVLYEDAFTDFKASVRYTYTRAGFEQDMIFLEQPPGPEVYGLDPATTQLQVLTEFLNPPPPRRPEKVVVDAAKMLAEGVEVEPAQPTDETLDFGSVQIGLGWGFRETGGLSVGGRGMEGNVPVRKQWLKLDGRDVLVEEVPVPTIEGELRALPKGKEGAWKPVDGSIRHAVLEERRLPERRLAQRPERKRPMQMAMASPTHGGFVMDYPLTLTGSLSNYTFKGDTTYYVSGPVYLYGNSVLEGGAVVKYTNNANAQLRFYGPFDCQTSPYRPAFFTAKDDNTVGEDISGSTNTPSGIYAYSCLYWSSPPAALDIHDVRVSFANYGVLIYPGGGYSHVLRNSQLCRNSTAIYVDTSTLLARNLLIYSNWRGYCGYGGTLKAEHLTVDQASIGFYEWTTGTMSVTNSLLTGVSSWSMGFTSYNNVTNSNGIFQTAGGGVHYLAANSSYRNAGTTNINSDLAAALRQRTTYPPSVYAGATITTGGNWGPQAQRDTDAPDLGYHYDPVDYLFGGADMNANVTFDPGTVVGWYRLTTGWNHAGHGIHLGDNRELTFDGRADNPCWWVHQTVAQELLKGYSPYSAGAGGITGWASDVPYTPVLTLRFAKCSGLPGGRNYFRDDYGVLKVNAIHSEFYGGGLGGYVSTVGLTNCLLDRASVWLEGGIAQYFVLRNCTARGGGLWINRWPESSGGPGTGWVPVRVLDCAFDGTDINTVGEHNNNATWTTYNYNAFKSGEDRTSPQGANDVLVSNFGWQNGSLGGFYLPTTSSLINMGSLLSAASVDLYHFTTTTDQVKETTTRLDIGYHYVALNGSGQQLDSDGDGSPDYADADADGDNLPDSWEVQYFGNLDQTTGGNPDGDDELTNLQEYQHGTDPTNWDTDGDGLSDSEELEIPVDSENLALGYLNPLTADSGNTGRLDGEKDGDHDGLGNWAELRDFGSEPWTANTFSATKDDAEYLMTAKGLFGSGGSSGTMVTARIPLAINNGVLTCSISGAFAHARYDIYFVNCVEPLVDPAQRWKYRRVLSDVQCDESGNATFYLREPDPNAGFFQVLDAADYDEDGLSNGYEKWFFHWDNAVGEWKHTTPTDRDSDLDNLVDGWEVEYGLSPQDSTDIHGRDGNPDGDGDFNVIEHNNYYQALPRYDATYDPRKASPSQRPVITISALDAAGDELGDVAVFEIRRSVPGGAEKPAMTVYYAVGGSATYEADYTVYPTPGEYPRIFSATIDAGSDAVSIEVRPVMDNVVEGIETVVVTVTPYSVAKAPQVSDPLSWDYVVDWDHNRAAMQIFDAKNLGDGFTVNLDKDAVTGYLRIKPTADTAPLPFVNVARSARGTVARIYAGSDAMTDRSRVVGEYYTAPDNGTPLRGDPSRTTVDRYGSVWVGNRGTGDADNNGSISCIGVVIGGKRGDKFLGGDGKYHVESNATGEYLEHDPSTLGGAIVYNTCVDRDGDGLIRTSWGRASGGQENIIPWPMGSGDVSSAQDEAIIHYVRTVPTNVRSIAVDRENDIWVGSLANGWQERIDGIAGSPITGQKLNFGRGGYGGLVDGYGTLWSAGYGVGLLRFEPSVAAPPGVAGGTLAWASAGYGVGIDPFTGEVWLGNYQEASIWRIDRHGNSEVVPLPSGSLWSKGVVVDGHGNVWVARSDGGVVHHLKTTGEYVGAVDLGIQGAVGIQPYGLCVDGNGMVWAACYGSDNAMRIDPSQNPSDDPSHVPPIGKVVEVVPFGGGGKPYNYSDLSGFVTLSTTKPAGFWDFVEDSGMADMVWNRVGVVAQQTDNSEIVIEVRAANRITDLPSWQFRAVGTAGVIPVGIKGRYLEVRATLMRDFCPGGSCSGPELRGLCVQWAGVGSPLAITKNPESVTVAAGGGAEFWVEATGESTYQFQWYKNGSPVGANSSRLTFGTVTYADAGRYSVQVTGAGAVLHSAAARLHVKGPAPSVAIHPEVLGSVTSGSEAMVHAKANPDFTGGPIYFQWRLNQQPIVDNASASGVFNAGSSCDCTLTLPVRCADTGGRVSVVFRNGYGAILSSDATLEVSSDIQFVSAPAAQYVSIGDSVPLTVTVSGAGPFKYTWYRTDVRGCREEIVSETAFVANSSDTFTINPMTPVEEGQYRLVVGSSHGCTAEHTFALVLTNERLLPPKMSPAFETSSSLRVTFSMPSSTDARIYYTTDGNCPSRGALGASTQTAIHGGSVIVSAGTTIQAFASRSHIAGNAHADSYHETWFSFDPMIIQAPANLTAGDTATFWVVALNQDPAHPPTWRWNSQVVGTGNSYTRGPVLCSDSGGLTATVTRLGGATAEAFASIQVSNPLAFEVKPESQTANLGSSASMTTTVSGPGPFRFMWYRNDNRGCYEQLVRDTGFIASPSDSYTLGATAPQDEGRYWVVVENQHQCSITSHNWSERPSLTLTGAARLPDVGISHVGAQVTLTVPGYSGCTIYYSTDNSCPSPSKVGQGTTVYSGPFSVPSRTVITAYATRSDRLEGYLINDYIEY